MHNNFFTLSSPEQATLIEKAAGQLGMPAVMIEKDYTQIINAGMFHETPPAFKDIVSKPSKLEKEINEQLKYNIVDK